MLNKPVITLTTDFGLQDPFAGIMKGVILGIHPDVKTVDITHNIQRHNITEASRVIGMSYESFPLMTIHIVVVDPGVGSQRRPILVITGDHFFIGPDNGVFSTVYEKEHVDSIKVIHLTSTEYFLPVRGSTFHGRDIFAPVAAWLAKGTDPVAFGIPIADYTNIEITKPVVSDNLITGEIASIDVFGNCISNIKTADLEKLAPGETGNSFNIQLSLNQPDLVKCYSDNKSSALSSVINSFGQLEFFIFKGSAAEKYNITVGDSVTVTLE